jgi:hypothetical protein
MMFSRILSLVLLTAHSAGTYAFTIGNSDFRVHNSQKTALSSSVGGGEIAALARIDRDFQLTTRSSNRPTGGQAGWTKLVLDSEDDNTSVEGEQQQKEFVYLLEPSTSPSSLILFLGGAGLGQYPHIAYNEFLSRLSQQLNAAVITAPYAVGLDHFELSKKSGENLRRAVIQCEENGGYSPFLPKFYLGHSLGSKLLTISLSATGMAQDVEGIGFLNYNNFGFSDTINMVKSFAGSMGGPGNNMGMYSQIFDFAEQAVSMSGIDFSPNPADTNKMISLRYDETFQRKTRLFIFNDDDLDSSKGFIEACQGSGGSGPSISNLPGNHLTSVFLKFGVDDLEIPDEAKMFADEVTGGFQNASFGNEDDLNTAVGEVYNWMVGKEPQRLPATSSANSNSYDTM